MVMIMVVIIRVVISGDDAGVVDILGWVCFTFEFSGFSIILVIS